ncbi:MAG: hypothetical protein NVSMB64_21510 [Candidatus Velthaea sp.]
MRAEDVERLADVLSRAYASPQDFRLRLRRYLQMPSARTFVVDHDGRPSGIVIGNDYATAGYVALMGVDPHVQRRGLATRLMEALLAWSDERGFACLELDATAAGAPLYERFGFIDAGETHVYIAERRGEPSTGARAYTRADRAQLVACDREAFGADRRGMLHPLLVEPQNRAFVREANGRIEGYAVAQPQAELIGPVIARTAVAAGDLIDAARSVLAPPYRLNVPAENIAASDTARERGFVFVRSLQHMVRGSRPGATRECIFARVNLGQG